MGRERRELGLPRLTPKLLWGLNGLDRVSPWNLTRCYLPMFSVRLQSSEGRTPDRSARKSPVVPSTERGASPVEHPGGNVRVAHLLTRHPKTARLRQTIARIRGEQDGRANAFGQFFARLTAVATASGERAASKPPLSCSSMERTGPAGELTLSIKIHDS